jgi:hypothetical protein
MRAPNMAADTTLDHATNISQSARKARFDWAITAAGFQVETFRLPLPLEVR